MKLLPVKICSVFKKTFCERKTKTVIYRFYKKFNQNFFNETLKNKFHSLTLSFEKFVELFIHRSFLLPITKKNQI